MNDEKQANHTIVDNAIINDERLSCEAKMVYVAINYLYQHGLHFSMEKISKLMKLPIQQVEKAIDELIHFEYLMRM